MKQKKKDRFARVAFTLNGLLFLMGGVMLLQEHRWWSGLFQLLAAGLNLGMLAALRHQTAKNRLDIAILFMNIVVSVSIAIGYIQAHKRYIQYAWFGAALISAVVLAVRWLKRRRGMSSQ